MKKFDKTNTNKYRYQIQRPYNSGRISQNEYGSGATNGCPTRRYECKLIIYDFKKKTMKLFFSKKKIRKLKIQLNSY